MEIHCIRFLSNLLYSSFVPQGSFRQTATGSVRLLSRDQPFADAKTHVRGWLSTSRQHLCSKLFLLQSLTSDNNRPGNCSHSRPLSHSYGQLLYGLILSSSSHSFACLSTLLKPWSSESTTPAPQREGVHRAFLSSTQQSHQTSIPRLTSSKCLLCCLSEHGRLRR